MKPRVLLADDDEMVRRAIASSLTRAGYEVVAVDDGGPAIEMSDERPFDFVIADLHMKKVGGIEVIGHYKAKFGAAVCCIVLSGDDDPASNANCFLNGADDVLMKPTSLSDLRQRLVSATRVRRGNAA